MRRALLLPAAVLTGFAVSASADEHETSASSAAEKSAACTDCHNSPISLSDTGVDSIIEGINAILAGSRSHPTELAELSEEDIAVIAEFLNTE